MASEQSSGRAGWQKAVAPPRPESRPKGLPRMGSSELREAAREVVSTYEGVTSSNDWLALVMPIVRLRAALNEETRS